MQTITQTSGDVTKSHRSSRHDGRKSCLAAGQLTLTELSLSLVTCLENKESSNIVSKLELSIYKELVNTIENIQAS